MNTEHIKYLVENHPHIHISESMFHGQRLRTLKYTRKVFFKGLWDEDLIRLRGLVIDDNYNIVQNPFKKVFNYGEDDTEIPDDALCLMVSKINGFMAAATYHKGHLLVSTTGTTDSDFAKMAYDMIMPHSSYLETIHDIENLTFLFEIVHTDDPHIVSETPGVYLLAIRNKSWDGPRNVVNQADLDKIASYCKFMRPSWKANVPFWEIKNRLKKTTKEGYMVYVQDKVDNPYILSLGVDFDYMPCVKFKSPLYLTSKFLGRMGDKNVEMMFDNPEQFKQKVDEEFYDVVDYLVENKEVYKNKDKQSRIEMVREFIMRKYDE